MAANNFSCQASIIASPVNVIKNAAVCVSCTCHVLCDVVQRCRLTSVDVEVAHYKNRMTAVVEKWFYVGLGLQSAVEVSHGKHR